MDAIHRRQRAMKDLRGKLGAKGEGEDGEKPPTKAEKEARRKEGIGPPTIQAGRAPEGWLKPLLSFLNQCSIFLKIAAGIPCDVFDPWVR